MFGKIAVQAFEAHFLINIFLIKKKRVLALQKQQIEIQREQNERYEKMMRETLEKQRKSDKEERERDREFFLQLGKIFTGSK